MTAKQLMAEIERFAVVRTRWGRGEATDRVYLNARKQMERAVAEAFKRKAAKR